MAHSYWKRIAYIGQLFLWGKSAIAAAEKSGDYGGRRVKFAAGTASLSGIGKALVTTLATQPNVAITTGVGALATNKDDLLADAALAAAGTGTFLDAYSLGAGVLDYPRTIAFKAGGGVGNNTFTGASAKGVLITGTDKDGNVIKELVALNAATAVYTKKAFKTVTHLDPALNFVGGTDHVAIGSGSSFALGRPCQSASDVVEYGVKASAATAYTITTLPTMDVGEAYAVLTGATGDATLSATVTTINLPTGKGTAFPSSRAMAEIISPDGSKIEEIIITAKSTDALTVVRGANGSTARAWTAGCIIAWRPGMTFTPGSITANDRFYLSHLTAID